MSKKEQILVRTEKLVVAAKDSANFAVINSLRNDLKKDLLFMERSSSPDQSNRMRALLSSLPKPQRATEKINYLGWCSFQLWKIETLREAGVNYSLSKQDLETFERFATRSERRRMERLK